jgi:CDP-paratose 2-epimerase
MRRVFITGGAGFIGCNAANRYLACGDQVVVFDNTSRPGGEFNLEWLASRRGALTVVRGDVRDEQALTMAIRRAAPDLILHLAAQVAVTTSVAEPRQDFETNALGTLNVLEAVRQLTAPPAVFYASTNKVYGSLHQLRVQERSSRYELVDRPGGIDEEQPLDFHSPYGCSKGAADQYVRDYARIYGLRTVTFRQSCIYGERQFGVEDQGWAAHMVIASLVQRPVQIYGDGKQVRDLLHVDDLLDAYDAAWDRLDHVAGHVFNVGGGPDNTASIWMEFGPLLHRETGRRPIVTFHDQRVGDQRVFISDNSKAFHLLGWRPRIGLRDGIERLVRWVASEPTLTASVAVAAGSAAAKPLHLDRVQ